MEGFSTSAFVEFCCGFCAEVSAAFAASAASAALVAPEVPPAPELVAALEAAPAEAPVPALAAAPAVAPVATMAAAPPPTTSTEPTTMPAIAPLLSFLLDFDDLRSVQNRRVSIKSSRHNHANVILGFSSDLMFSGPSSSLAFVVAAFVVSFAFVVVLEVLVPGPITGGAGDAAVVVVAGADVEEADGTLP